MGLDMNLYREVYLKDQMEIVDSGVAEILGKDGRKCVNQSVAYWRKFNALHNYFRENFNDHDNDNCVDMYMDIDDIKTLLKLVKKIRKQVVLVDGYVNYYSSSEKVEDLKGHKIGDEVYKEVSKLRKVEDNIKSIVITEKYGDLFYLDFRGDGKVISNPSVCEELPTEDGFFFGDTDYNENYVYQLDETIKQLNDVVKDHKELVERGVDELDIDYYYRAWY